MKSVLVSMCNFKGTLSNDEASTAVAHGLGKLPYEIQSVADGGRGTLNCVMRTLPGEIHEFDAMGSLGGKVHGRAYCLPNATNPHSILIESSDTCGYEPKQNIRDPMLASSYGMGKLLQELCERWNGTLRNIYIGLGDSAISDAGAGMLAALGVKYFDSHGHSLLGNGSALDKIDQIQTPPLPLFPSLSFTVLCDVNNPLCGKEGSARTFSPQKGATPSQVLALEKGMKNFSSRVAKITHKDISNLPRTGSAGGLSFTFASFFNANLVSGSEFLLNWINYDRYIERHSVIITGEGRTDRQTFEGKAPMEVVRRAQKLGRRVFIVSGAVSDNFADNPLTHSIAGYYACGDKPNPQEALSNKVAELIKSGTLAL